MHDKVALTRGLLASVLVIVTKSAATLRQSQTLENSDAIT